MTNETIDIASKEMWERAKTIYLATLQSADEKSQVDRYLSMITSVTSKGGNFTIYTANAYAADYLKDNYSERLKKCLELVSNGLDIRLDFRCDVHSKPVIVVPQSISRQVSRPSRVSTFVSTMPLNEEYTFNEFVRGPSNSFALAAAMAVVKNPGKSSYNPLFIHGGTGLGKTHLMQAIGNELRRLDPSLAICYLTAEEYLNEYVNYMKDNNVREFRNKYRTIDVLLLDDVQFFQKGKAVQEEFFNTFNALQQAKKQIVMTSDVAPKNLPAIEARLISRFEGGMLQEIESPSYETRLAILKKKAEGIDINVPISTLEFIADNIKSHVRAMEGALGKVSVFLSSFNGTTLNNEILSHLLKDFIEKEQSLRKLSIEEIQTAVAKKYNVSIAQILSAERTQSIVTPRQLSMYIARKFTTKSLPEIAKLFDKTHATIIHGVRNIEKRLDVESDLKVTLSEILSEFGYKLSDKMD
jgi:chromosomal replication initiator protein